MLTANTKAFFGRLRLIYIVINSIGTTKKKKPYSINSFLSLFSAPSKQFFKVYAIAIAISVLCFTLSKDLLKCILHPLLSCYTSLLFIIVALTFAVYGFRIYFLVKRPLHMRGMAKKIGRISVICSILFFIRSVNILIDLFVITSEKGDLIQVLISCVFFELFPTYLILFILAKKQKQRITNHTPLTTSTISSTVTSTPSVQ